MKTTKLRPNVDASTKSSLELQEVVEVDPGHNDMHTNEKPVQEIEPTTSTEPNEDAKMCQQIQQCNYHTVRKLLWGFVVLGLTSGCLWHLVDRIGYYWSEPTLFQISVHRLHKLQFPAITVCPARKAFQDGDWHAAFPLSSSSVSPKSKFTFEDAWNEYAVTEKDVQVKSVCNEDNVCDTTNGLPLALTSSPVDTFLGRCVTLSQGVPVRYQGDLTYWVINILPGRYGFEGAGFDQPSAVLFFLHDPYAVHHHEAVFLSNSLSPHKHTGIQLTLKQYEFQNLSRDPCYNQKDVIDCRNTCIDDSLDRSLNCSLPFMTSKWPPCRTVSEAMHAFDQASDFYKVFDWTKCVCRRQCRETMYVQDKEMLGDTDENMTLLSIAFGDNLIEKVYEEYAYTFSDLVSDIGGSVGIFLGLSIYSLFKFLDKYLLKGVQEKV